MRRLRMKLMAAACVSIGLAGCSLTRPPAQVEAPVPAQWHAPCPTAARSRR